MIEAAAPDGTITQAFSWLPPAGGARRRSWVADRRSPRPRAIEVPTVGGRGPAMDDRPADGGGGPGARPGSPGAGPAAGELVTETLGYDGGRQVTVHVPPDPPRAVVFAGDGQGSRGGAGPWRRPACRR